MNNALEIKNIHYKIGNKPILNGLSLEIKKGDCISIVGPSGSGKSTFLKLCADLITPSQGEIKFNGKSYCTYNPCELRKKISYCTQTPYLFGDTVMDNIEFPYKIRGEELDKTRIDYLLKITGLDESILYKDINHLSGGEKQRIGIIRSLIYIPEVLLLDESTSALDEKNTKNIEKFIKSLNEEGVTVLWITHSNEQSQSIFNKRIEISNGKIEKVEVIA